MLQDIFLLKRQIRGGNETGIPDMIGLDSEGNVCIIEMKNVSVMRRSFRKCLSISRAGMLADSVTGPHI